MPATRRNNTTDMLQRNRRREIDARHGLGPYRRPITRTSDLEEVERTLRQVTEERTHPGELSRIGGYRESWEAFVHEVGWEHAREARWKDEEELDQLQQLLCSPSRAIRHRITEHFNSAKMHNEDHWNATAQHKIELFWKTYDSVIELTTSFAMIEESLQRSASIIRTISRVNQDLLASAHHHGAWTELRHLVREEGEEDPLTDNESETSEQQNAREYYPGRERVEDGLDGVELRDTVQERALTELEMLDRYASEDL